MKKKHFVHLALALYRLFGTTLFSAHQRIALINVVCDWARTHGPSRRALVGTVWQETSVFHEGEFRAVVSSGRPNWNQGELKEQEREGITR